MKPVRFPPHVVLLIGWLVASCSPVRYVNIETYNPASITFPANVKSVLIVNHATAQPEIPFESTFRRLPDSVRITADGAILSFCRTLGREIAESPCFEEVRLYEGTYAGTLNDVRPLCEEHAADAVISLDRLFFSIHENRVQLYGMDAGIEMEVSVSGILSVRLPDRETPLRVIPLSDTIRPRLYPEEEAGYAGLLLDPRTVPDEIAEYMAARSAVHFVPYWSADTRWYYVASAARWKEASAYAAAEKWEKAAPIWESGYEKAASLKAKARLASNLALCAELTGDLTRALSWATRAYQHLLALPGKEDPAVQMQKTYMEVLEHRIQAEKKLRLQIQAQ